MEKKDKIIIAVLLLLAVLCIAIFILAFINASGSSGKEQNCHRRSERKADELCWLSLSKLFSHYSLADFIVRVFWFYNF